MDEVHSRPVEEATPDFRQHQPRVSRPLGTNTAAERPVQEYVLIG